MSNGARVVIVGGGFAGLTAAQGLDEKTVQLVVVDRHNHHLFQPLLYQVAMAALGSREIATPIRSILRKQANTKVLLAEVTDIDLKNKCLALGPAGTLPYDYLILAPGARTHYFGHEEWAHFAPGLKDLDDAVEIRRRVLLAFEAAEREPNVEKRARLLSFVVIGGGPTGVELAGAIAELARHILSSDFRNIGPLETQVLLVEAGSRILSSFSLESSQAALRQLSTLGVQVRTESPVEQIDRAGVKLRTGEVLNAETILWAAGVTTSALIAKLGVETDRLGRAKVNSDCSVLGYPEVFVIGDAAMILQENGAPVPGVSAAAMQMGRYVAGLIRGEIRAAPGGDNPRTAFLYHDKGSMATIGRSRAVAEVGGLKLSGLLAWLAWLVVHIWYLIGFRNRIVVIFDWARSYFSYRRGARLITGGRLEPGPPAIRPPIGSNDLKAVPDNRHKV